MDEKNLSEFEMACENYLYTVSIGALRSYGRMIGLKEPTKLRKNALIKAIIGALGGESMQQRSNRGAPVKNDYVEPKVIQTIEELKEKYGLKDKETDGASAETQTQTEEEKPPVFATFEVNFSLLNAKQKKLLINFLGSL